MKEEEARHWSPSYPISGTNLIEGGSSLFPGIFQRRGCGDICRYKTHYLPRLLLEPGLVATLPDIL